LTPLYVELPRILLATAFMAAVVVGVGSATLVLLGRDRLGALPFATFSVAGGFFAIHLVELARYALGLPGWTGAVVLSLLAIGGVVLSREGLLRMWRREEMRDALAALGAVALGLVGSSAVIHTFGGGDWQADWLGHYLRAVHWLTPRATFVDELGYNDNIPSRPPMGNHLAAAFMSVSGTSFAAYQVAMAICASSLLLPLGWALEEMGGSARPAATVGALLLIHPMFVQNATYPWTKLSAAFFVAAGLVVAQRTLRGLSPRSGAPVAIALLGAATLAHYAILPYLLAVAAALGWHATRASSTRAPGTPGDSTPRPNALASVALIGAPLFFVVGPWLVTSWIIFGADMTFAPFTGRDLSAARVARALGDVVATLVPHSIRGVSLAPIAQSSAIGMLRDQLFLVYQTCALLSAGSIGLVAALATPSGADAWPRARAWMGLGAFVVATVAWAHPWPAPFGLAHIGLTPLALLLVPLTALVWKRGGAWRWVLGLLGLLDLSFGILLHLGLESAPIELDGSGLHPSGLGAALSEAVRTNRRFALDAGVQTLGERLGPLRVAGFVVFGTALAWLLARARLFASSSISSGASSREGSEPA
jgi:hypothetical protein